MEEERLFNIAVGKSSKSKQWKNKKMSWNDIVEKLSQTTRTPETVEEYKNMPKTDRDRLKDVGGFVAGYVKDGRRLKTNILNRSLLTLDIDYYSENIEDLVSNIDYAFCLYSTHSHRADNQRYRLIIPMDKEMKTDEYQAISRMVASKFNIEIFDPTTHDIERLMYWPSTSCDGDYVFKCSSENTKFLKADDVLNEYTFGWKDVSSWPMSSHEKGIVKKQLSKQEDPLTKKGIIGAFCRTYSITEAIEEFISDIYVPGADNTRYTYAEGSTTGGVVIYDDKFSYSHHGTDPASNICCNAFDLVRIHKFGELDEEAKEGTPANRLPSFTKMSGFAASDNKVMETIGREKMLAAQEDFDQVEEEISTEWLKKLEYTESGRLKNTIDNFSLTIENEPLLKGKISYDEFSNKIVIKGDLPWRKKKDYSAWSDTDDSGLKSFIEKYYGISSVSKYFDAFKLVIAKNYFHPVKQIFDNLKWDGVERIETLLVDYLGAEDNLYTRFVMKKWLVAGVKRIYNPGCKFDYMPILSGKQGVGKSTFFKKLGLYWFTDESIDLKDSKKAIELLRGKLVVEMAELANMKKAEVEIIKSFISRTGFEARLAYEKRNTELAIQWIYCGTTNDKEFLKDKTGNRRFWPVDIYKVEPTKSIFNDLNESVILQIWAEAVNLYNNGYSITLNEIENKYAESEQESHMEIDEIEQILNDKLNWDAPKEQWDKYNYTEIVTSLNLSDRQRGYARQNLKTILAKKGINQDSRRRYMLPPMRNLKSLKDFDSIFN